MKTPETHPHLPWEVIDYRYVSDDDRVAMDSGCHFDYVTQTWVDGHDHAHVYDDGTGNVDDSPLVFCGADRETCEGGAR